jgi:23S rRNA pseudouridine1911/1915/1917 synthase
MAMSVPESTLIHGRPMELRVSAEEAGERLDRYVQRRQGELSRTAIQRLIEAGEILVNGERAKSGYSLRAGDVIRLLTSAPVRPPMPPPRALPLDILYEDADLLVVNKAPGVVVHPAPGHEDDTLVNALLAHRPELRGVGSELRPGIVHRLDKDTSGLLLVAKHLRALNALAALMQQRRIHKRYLALVEGQVALEQGTIDAPIGRDPRNRQLMTITAREGRQARTHFRVLRHFARHTLLLVEPETGRTHQIRVHLRAIGHPVAGDSLYGRGTARHVPGLERQFLHAYQLSLPHPISGLPLEFEAPLPPDLQAVLARDDLL